MSNSITIDQLDVLALPLGKAKSILELFVMDLPCDQANGAYVVLDLLEEVNKIAHSFADEPKDTVSKLNGKTTDEDQEPKPASKVKVTEPTESLDNNLSVHFGPDVTVGDVANFIDRKFHNLNTALMMIQSDEHLENNGGDSAGSRTRADGLMAAIDSVAELNSAWGEFGRLGNQEASS